MMRRWIGVVLIACCLGCSAIAPGRATEVRIEGSDTMLFLNRRLAEEFMKEHPGVVVRVAGGGTGTGVDALVAGRADLCSASRPFLPEEVEALYVRFGTLGVRYLVALDAISIYLHPANPVRDLTMEQLRRIFRGEIGTWDAVGGESIAIVPVVRPPHSGTRRFFRDHVLEGADALSAAVELPRTRDVTDWVRGHRGAIGYGGMAYGGDLVRCAIDGIPPDEASVRDRRYPLSRYLYFYAAAPATGRVEEFLDWCLGEEGQLVAAGTGFIPLWVDDRLKSRP
jgi:phosphate transport system substrate-binding protein